MPKWYETNSFKSLEEFWYERLEKAGFVDAEKKIGNSPVLIQNAPNAYRQAPPLVRQHKADYYRMLGECVHQEKWDDTVDKLVMSRLAEGAKIKQISAELKKKRMKHHRQTIRFIIRKYEVKWHIKNYKQNQLTSKR